MVDNKMILVINAGSSSLKYQIIDIASNRQYLSGIAEGLTTEYSSISWQFDNEEKQSRQLSDYADHSDALLFLIDHILVQKAGLKEKIYAVGHRLVHGGEYFSQPILIDDNVITKVEEISNLAPLHNPANIMGVKAAKAAFSNVPHVAVFDTAFHQTMPKEAYLYGLPYEFYEEHHIRRYGFHGTSHAYIVEQAAKYLNKPVDEVNIISAHLGNGASICAIKNGISVDTSMGMTPLDGLLMGSRCGRLDPSIVLYIHEELGIKIKELTDILNKKSGMRGISGHSSDARILIDAAENGNERAELALNMFAYLAAKEIAAYFVPLQTIDAIVFTGGIGENSIKIRANIVNHLRAFSYELDEDKNNQLQGKLGEINKNDKKILIIPTNEELMIAKLTQKVINDGKN